MHRTIIFIFLFLSISPVFSQDHVIDLEKKPYFPDFHLFLDVPNGTTYWFELEGNSLTEKKLAAFNVLNTTTQKTEKRRLKRYLSLTGKFLRAYYYENNFWFLNHDIKNDEVIITPQSTKKNLTKGKEKQVINIPLENRERVYITHQRGDQIFVFSKEERPNRLKVHVISLSTGKILKLSRTLENRDASAFVSRFSDERLAFSAFNFTDQNTIFEKDVLPKIVDIDYSNRNYILDFVSDVKLFFDENEVVLLIEHSETSKVHLYKFDLETGKTDLSYYKMQQNSKLYSFNTTYYNKMLYRITSSFSATYFDIIDTKTTEIIFSKLYTKNSNYPFDFQASNGMNHKGATTDNNRKILQALVTPNVFIYPEITEKTSKIYIGSVSRPSNDRLKPISKKLQKVPSLRTRSYKRLNWNLYEKPIVNLPFSEKICNIY